jgi:thymidylate kinase
MTSVGALPKIDKEKEKSIQPQAVIPFHPLIQELCNLLRNEEITYCHWKSNDALDRSASGENDLDLLISRADETRFTEIVYRLGFKQAIAPAIKQMPGVLDYYGYASEEDKFVHVHAHYQLVLGDDMTKNFRLPIEKPYLESAAQNGLFMVPEIEFEYIVFIIRMMLKHFTWDAILTRQGKLKTAERRELEYLESKISRNRVNEILNEHLPFISVELFHDCTQSIKKSDSLWKRMRTAQRLQNQIKVYARHPLFDDVLLKLWRRTTLMFRRRIIKSPLKYQLASGGAMIAILGGDGAGKTTAVNALHEWLSKDFDTAKAHIGKPRRSWTTIAVRGILKIGNLLGLYPQDSSFQKTLKQQSLISPGYPWLLREVCRARDRFQTFKRAQHFASNGGLVVVDRYPHPLIKIMDGPQTEQFLTQLVDGHLAKKSTSPKKTSPTAKKLVEIEESYYEQIVPPEAMILLRLDPEIAVERKTDEDPNSVRERSTEIWNLDWRHLDTHIIDASKSKKEVLERIKYIVWSNL